MKLIPGNLLAIVAAAAVAAVFGTYAPVHQLLTVGFVVAAVAVMVRAAPGEGIPPTAPIAERDAERVLTIGAYAGALAVCAPAPLIALVLPDPSVVPLRGPAL